MRCLYTSYARAVPDRRGPDEMPGMLDAAERADEPAALQLRRKPPAVPAITGRPRPPHWALPPPTSSDMNRRYAYRDYAILVSAQPAADAAGWRPEICVIAPDDRWEFVPTHHSLVSNDPQYCLEIGRRCAESAIQSMDPARELAARPGLLH